MLHDCAVWRGNAFRLNAPLYAFRDSFVARLSERNKGSRIERDAEGVLEIRPPVGGTMSIASAHLSADVCRWNRDSRLGEVFGCQMGYRLPNTAVRSPDVSWVGAARWAALTEKQKRVFPALCPDFAAELVPYDVERADVEVKMREYQRFGLRLGWLLDPLLKRAVVYRAGREVEVLSDPASLSGEDVLPGFALDLAWVWGDLA